MKPREGFILIGGVHRCLEDVFRQAHFLAGKAGHECAWHRVGLWNRLALRQQLQRRKAAASRHHFELAGLSSGSVQDRPDGQVLQQSMGCNRGGEFFNTNITAGLAHIGERGNELRQGDHPDKGFIGHGGYSIQARVRRILRAEPLPVGETGGGKGQGRRRRGVSPNLHKPRRGAEGWGYAASERSGPCLRQGRSPSGNEELTCSGNGKR